MVKQNIQILFTLFLLFTLASCTAPPPEITASVPQLVFDGGFESGNQTPWSAPQYNAAERSLSEQFEIVTAPVRQGQYAAKFTVHDGDEFRDTGGERCDLSRPLRQDTIEVEGRDFWYAWSTMFSEDWQPLTPPDDWMVILDWHSTYDDICQLLQIEMNNNNALSAKMLTGDVTGYDCFDGPGTAYKHEEVVVEKITPGKWNDFIIHVYWTTSENGIVEIWHKLEGEAAFTKVMDVSGVPTLQYMGDPERYRAPYLKLAHYRSDSQKHTSVLYHDGFRQSLTAEGLVEGDLYDLSASRSSANQWLTYTAYGIAVIALVAGIMLLVKRHKHGDLDNAK
jgi:hypothetical protein